MTENEKLNQYDKLIAVTFTNINSLAKKEDIVLSPVDFHNKTHKVFVEVAIMVSNLLDKKLYLKTNFFHFLKIKMSKKSKRIKFNFLNKPSNVDIDFIARFQANANGYTDEIYADIYDAYYERG